MKPVLLHRSALRPRQQGVAAIEFALIAMIMVVMLTGLLVFWRAYQAQQSLTRAAGDGARLAHSLIAAGKQYPCGVSDVRKNQQAIQASIGSMVQKSLQNSNMPGTVESSLRIAYSDWDCKEGRFSFEVTYSLPSLIGESYLRFEPTELIEKSIVHFAPLV